MSKTKEQLYIDEQNKNADIDFTVREQVELPKESIGKFMTRLIWGDEVADKGWVDPRYKSHE